MPVAPLKIVYLNGSHEIAKPVDNYIVKARKQLAHDRKDAETIPGYIESSYLLEARYSRYGTGEGKVKLSESVRGSDLYIIADVTNYTVTYKVCGRTNHMSPDNYFQDLKRVISAASGKAHRISVILPFLYESRQHRRTGRESLDCALALQELTDMGVDNIVTFDAHDPRVHNAIPLKGFESVSAVYQFIKYLLLNVGDLIVDSDHMMVISPDEGGMGRAVYFASVLGLDMGMFYKRRDYTTIVDGRNPIVAHEFLGTNVEGKDVIVIDDMISSGDSILDVAKELKARKANRVIAMTTFGLFTNGFDKFDKAYEEGLIYKILTTNLVYQPPELLKKEWYINVDMNKYIALIIDTINHDASVAALLTPIDRIHEKLKEYNESKGSIDIED